MWTVVGRTWKIKKNKTARAHWFAKQAPPLVKRQREKSNINWSKRPQYRCSSGKIETKRRVDQVIWAIAGRNLPQTSFYDAIKRSGVNQHNSKRNFNEPWRNPPFSCPAQRKIWTTDLLVEKESGPFRQNFDLEGKIEKRTPGWYGNPNKKPPDLT